MSLRLLFLIAAIVTFTLLAFHIQVGTVNLWALGVVFYLCSLLPLTP